MDLVGGFRGVLAISRKENFRNGSSTSCVLPLLVLKRRDNRASQLPLNHKSTTVELLNSPEQRRPWAPWFPTSVVENTRLGQFGNWRLRSFLGTNSTAVKQSHLYWNYRHLPRPRSPRHLLHAAVSCVCQCQSRLTRQPTCVPTSQLPSQWNTFFPAF